MTEDPADIRRSRPRQLRRRVLLAIGTALVTLGVLEGALWLLHPLPPVEPGRLHRFLPSWTHNAPVPRTAHIDPGPLHGVTPGIVEADYNSLGFLFPEERLLRAAADEVRVAVVGGSTVECVMLAPDRRWSAALEARLRTALARPVTVLNLGVSGQDTRTHLATTAHVVTALDVDVCVFMLGANDLGLARWDVHPMLGGSAFYPASRWSRDIRDLLRHTQLARHLGHLRESSRPTRTAPYFGEEVERQASLPLSPEPIHLDEAGLSHYARNVVTLAGICREHGTAALFTTQPCMFSPQPSPEELSVYWGCHDGTHRIAPENFSALLDAINARLMATCQLRGYACVDLASLIPKGLGSFYDQVHFNEPGARRVADALAEPVIALLR